jgi:TonB-dependent SusC/RagA subfamily outer membrane receptor
MMKKLLFILLLIPIFIHGNDKNIPTKIKKVTVYMSGAQITRTANLYLKAGASEYTFTGLSHKIDESSIQLSELQSVSILSMAYNIDYLSAKESNPEIASLVAQIEQGDLKISLLKNNIAGLEEEQKIFNTNRLISGADQELNLEKIKQISTYYRERTTAIKNEIFTTKLQIAELSIEKASLTNQLTEMGNAPKKEEGVIRVKFDSPIATTLNLEITYAVQDAGWIPNYDIKSEKLNAPLTLNYKAHVYQKTGVNWNNVKISLSSGNPTLNVTKPLLGTKYLDFVSRYSKRYESTTKKQKYFYNPTVKKVVGQVTDADGSPLPGVNIVIKGTSNGTTADFDGYYTLTIPKGKTLIYSYIGFRSTEMPIYSSVMNVGLEEDVSMLEEVVVSGYAKALQGRAAGVSIRGVSSNNSYSRPSQPKLPLYVIDGVPVDGFMEGDLDESEIQSIEILNRENSQVLYGSRGSNGVVIITTKKSNLKEGITNTRFEIKKTYSITSNGDITAIELNTFQLDAKYEHFAVPIVNENVFMTTTFTDWEQYNLLPGEANIYFEGTFAGKTTLDPYTAQKEMTLSLGIDPNITVTRKQIKNFKSKSFTGSNRILDRTYELVVKNNKATPIHLKLMDRVPLSQNKEIKVVDIETPNAAHDAKKGLLTWKMQLDPKESKTENFSFQVKYPKYKTISL